MVFSYLFEVKSIQAYLFNTGKLKDIIAASERIDNLIDDRKNSILSQVLCSSDLNHDLHDETKTEPPNLIRFIRNKGGAFYAYCQTEQPLLDLRSVWTLTIQQLFPNLEFLDALVKKPSLNEALAEGYKKLAADSNIPQIKFPLATAIAKRSQRTDGVSVPVSIRAKKEAWHFGNARDKNIDSGTAYQRQAYQTLGMNRATALHDKFTPEDLKGKLHYPIDLENEFQFTKAGTAKNTQQITDIGVIHIDGNGFGAILRELKSTLNKSDSDEKYRKAFRGFSKALATATEKSAQAATQWLYDQWQQEETKQSEYIPMRPIVLGGDDITLLCRDDLALGFSKTFCTAFKKASEDELAPLFKDHLSSSNTLEKHLTASGGILYHKAAHPFTHSHQIVEELCAKAKQLTKKIDPIAGPAALAFYRLSNSVVSNVEQQIAQSQSYIVKADNQHKTINLGLNTYLVESDDKQNQVSFNDIEKCVEISNNPSAPISMNLWREMATHLSRSNMTEANRIYQRAQAICSNEAVKIEQLNAIHM